MTGRKKSRGNIRTKVLFIVSTVLAVTILGNFIISAESVEKTQITSFDREVFATAGGLQTNINSLIAKSFLPYTDIVNCEPLLDSFVENNEDVLYTYTTDENGEALYMSESAVSDGISNERLVEVIHSGEKLRINDKEREVLYYILPLQEEEEMDDKAIVSIVGALVVAYPRSCITEPLRRLYLYNALLAGITFSTAFLLMYYFLTKLVTKPLQVLDGGIRKVSQKGFENTTLEIGSSDEIGQIARTFNDMLGQLAVTTVSKDYINSILHNMSEALFVVDVDKRIETVNDAAMNLLGYSQEDIIGKTVEILYAKPEDNPYGKCNFSEDGERNKETEFITKNGNIIPVSVNWSVVSSDNSKTCKYVCTARDITDIKKAQKILIRQANYDELTHLHNRYNLEQCMERLLKDVKGTHFFIVIDLDKFKQVNDICGHAAGDRLLQQIAHMLKNAVGEKNYVARLGGDEFAIIMYNTDKVAMTAAMNGLLKNIGSYSFTWEGKAFHVGMSIGAYEICRNGEDWLSVFNAADKASYIAKKTGGNKLHIYTSEDEDISDEDETVMFAEINDAFDKGRFFLAYLPITPLNGAVESDMYEVTLRMRREDGTVLEQGAFGSVMERYRKLLQLEQWAIHHFCESYHSEIKEMHGAKSVQFNISISDEALCMKQFAEFVRQEFVKYDVPPGEVCFQVQESSMISYFVEVTTLMKSLGELGCKFAINELGMGMSSFMYLRMLPVSYIKLSGGFVKEMGRSVVDMSIVKSINDIAHLLNIKTIAEDVNCEEILEIVQKIGIDYAHGDALYE